MNEKKSISCDTMHQLILEGKPITENIQRAHLETCQECQEILEDHDFLNGVLSEKETIPQPFLDGLFERIETDLQIEKQKWTLFHLSTKNRIGLLLCFCCIVFVWLVEWKRYENFSKNLGIWMTLSLLLFGCLMASLIWLTLRPLYLPPFPHWLSSKLLPIFGFLAPVLFALLSPFPQLPTESALSSQKFWMATQHCFFAGIMSAVPIIFIVFLFLRVPPSFLFVVKSAAFGGLFGNIALQIQCPGVASEHLLVGHSTVGIGIFMLGLGAYQVIRWFTKHSHI